MSQAIGRHHSVCCSMLQCAQKMPTLPHRATCPTSPRTSTANPTWGDIFECCFKAQNSQLERVFPLKRGKRDVRALSFELSKMSPQVELAVVFASAHVCISVHTPYRIWSVTQSAFGVFINLNLQSQSHWSVFKGAWQESCSALDHRLIFGNACMCVCVCVFVYVYVCACVCMCERERELED